jgi:hypothetical protein
MLWITILLLKPFTPRALLPPPPTWSPCLRRFGARALLRPSRAEAKAIPAHHVQPMSRSVCAA